MAVSPSVAELRQRLGVDGTRCEPPGLPGVACLPGSRSAVVLVADTEANASWARRRDDVLSRDEVERAARFIFPGLGETWTGARVLLREVLGRAMRMAAADVVFQANRFGKPMAEGVEFSLSHKDSIVLIGVSDLPLGVDVEKLPGDRTVQQVGAALHPKEAAELLDLAADERSEAFTRAWVRKEAMLKAMGVGLSRGISKDYVSTGATPRSPVAGLRICDVALPGLPGHRAALCTTAAPAIR